MNDCLSAISPPKEKLTAAALVGRGSEFVLTSRRRKSRRVRADSSNQRNLRMVIEMGWLTLGMTVQLYLTDVRGYLVVCGMLITYILFQFRRAGRISRLVWLLSLGLALGSLGSLATGNFTDLLQPLHLGLCSLALIGFFLSEYHREEDARFLARLIVILLPIAVWQSIARNGLAKEWAEGGRRGVNLAALFMMLAGTYCFLLRKRWMLLAVPFYLGVLILGSRTTFVTALAFPVIYCMLIRSIRNYFLRNIPIMLLVLVALAISLAFVSSNLVDIIKAPLGGSLGTVRFNYDAVESGGTQRANLTVFWLKALWEKPTFFGNGFYTYGAAAEYETWPHNGILHVFNGLGVICGAIYLWVIVKVMIRLWQMKAFLPKQIAWAAAFFVTMFLRSFGEAQLFVAGIHIAGFAITYGSGLAIWGVEHSMRIKRGIRRMPATGRIQSIQGQLSRKVEG